MSFSAVEEMDAEVIEVTPVNYQLARLDANQFMRVWPMISDLMESVFERSGREFTADSLLGAIQRNLMQFWLVTDGEAIAAVVGTSIEVAPSGKRVCEINFCAGHERNKWIGLLDEIEAWAAYEGCASMKVIARKGWAKALPDYRMTHVVLEKDI